MAKGAKPWIRKMPQALLRQFLLRRRADLAEPFSELILTPHPWDHQALALIEKKIVQTFVLFAQLKSSQ